jgi:hypothetical protein
VAQTTNINSFSIVFLRQLLSTGGGLEKATGKSEFTPVVYSLGPQSKE